MNTTYKILSNEERTRIERQLLKCGRAWLEKDPQTAIFLAEQAQDRRDDVAAYAYLLRALRLGAKDVPAQATADYQKAAEATPKEVLKEADSYEGCLELAKEYFTYGDEDQGIYYMAFAMNSEQDVYGVAACKIADHFSANPANHALWMGYERIAAHRGNPDLIPSLCGRASARREEAVV